MWPLGLPRLSERLLGCAAPSRIWESNLSRRSWLSGGAAAAADSARARGRQASAAPIGYRARGAAVLIIIFQPRRRRAPLTARRARGRGLGSRGNLLRDQAVFSRCLGCRAALALASLSPSSSSSSCPLPRSFPAAPPAPWPPVALLLRPALLGSPQSAWPRCARGSLFRRWRVAVVGGLLRRNQDNLCSNFRGKKRSLSMCHWVSFLHFLSGADVCFLDNKVRSVHWVWRPGQKKITHGKVQQ
nr:uncharacterized protein LOC105857770 [Microcebus murinus]